MKIADDVFRWYGQGCFDAEAMTRGTGLPERSQRLLAKLGILQPVPQAKTKPRLFDRRMLKRAAVIAPLQKLALSLQAAGTIIYAAPGLERFTFGQLDPWQIMFGPVEAPAKGLPPTREHAGKFSDPTWFDPETPPHASTGDYLIEIVNGHYVAHTMLNDPLNWAPSIYGELVDDMTKFVWWSCYEEVEVERPGEGGVQPLVLRRNVDNSMSADMLKWNVRDVSNEEQRATKLVIENPVTKITLNASLALRIALRRLLYIDPLIGEDCR